MKPKRPTETDLLAIVKNGFQEQLSRDREAQAPAPLPSPALVAPRAAEPAALVPMVRITLAIPEDLRYRLKLAMLDHRRENRSRITQDDYCAQAIAARLDQEELGRSSAGNASIAFRTSLTTCSRSFVSRDLKRWPMKNRHRRPGQLPPRNPNPSNRSPMKRQQITVEVPGTEQRQIPRKKAYEIEEAAELLSLGRTSLFRLLKEGKIRGKRVGARVIIADAELERFANDPEPVTPEKAS